MQLGLELGLNINKKSSSSQGLLDQFEGAVAAYSLRYLSSSYVGNVVLVRRSSDNAEQGFTPSEIIDGTLETFCGAGNGFVKTWYDQIGSNHFQQSSTSKQPLIVTSGVLNMKNGTPCIISNGTNNIMQTPTGVMGNITEYGSFIVGAFNETGQSSDTFYGISNGTYSSSNNWIIFRQSSGINNFRATSPSTFESSDYLTSDTDQHLFFNSFTGGSSVVMGVDGNENDESSTAPASIDLSQEIDLFAINSGTSEAAHGAISAQELIVYNSNQSANRAAIETAINSYYSIY